MTTHFITVKVEAPTLENATDAVLDAIDYYLDRGRPRDLAFVAIWPHENSVQKPAHAGLSEKSLQREPRHWPISLWLTEREKTALRELSEELGMSMSAVMIQGLRLYQLHHKRLQAGETVVWSGDKQRMIDFAAGLTYLGEDSGDKQRMIDFAGGLTYLGEDS